MTFEDIEKIANKLNFDYNYYDNMYGENEPGIEIGQYTPLGEDWFETFEAGSPEEFIKSLKSRVDNWDVDDEAAPFIEMMGRYGIPEDEEGLIEDAEWKLEQLKDLYNALV